jgi:hypothetical protein
MRQYALRRESPEQTEKLLDQALRERRPRDASPRRVLCRSCRSPVSSDRERIPIEGSHLHRRTNPAGIEFEFGCFLAAPGAAVVGEATDEFSWFSGYAWAYSICRSCAVHLGWHFEGRDPSFHGLILDRLEQESPAE